MCTTAACMQVVTQMTQNQSAQSGNAAAHSTAAVVPAVTSVARLDHYTTVAAFNTSERARVGFGFAILTFLQAWLLGANPMQKCPTLPSIFHADCMQ